MASCVSRRSWIGCSPGGVVEWLMAPVLKTGVPKGTVGSNPTSSVFRPSCLHASCRRPLLRERALIELDVHLSDQWPLGHTRRGIQRQHHPGCLRQAPYCCSTAPYMAAACPRHPAMPPSLPTCAAPTRAWGCAMPRWSRNRRSALDSRRWPIGRCLPITGPWFSEAGARPHNVPERSGLKSTYILC